MLVNQVHREAGVQGAGNEPVQAEGRHYVQIPAGKDTGAEGRGAGCRSDGEGLECN